MSLKVGIIGLPNVGKSTLFNALTRTRGARAENYPFCTVDPNVGVVEVRDERLKEIAAMVHPEKVIPAVTEFVDIAGLVRGASRGEGLGNQFLSHIREVDAICEVVRFFRGGDVVHVEGDVDPRRDREIVEAELILADLDTVERRWQAVAHAVSVGRKEATLELAVLTPVRDALRRGNLASTVFTVAGKSVSVHQNLDWSHPQEDLAMGLLLLTCKPLLYAVNVSEEQLAALHVESIRKELGVDGGVFLISAKIEEEMQDLSSSEEQEYLRSLGVESSGLDQLIRETYAALGLQTFFTAGPKEVRAWTVRIGATAPQASGVIHSDFERGFIAAEVIHYDDYIAYGGESGAKAKGKMRVEGKEYVVRDGDILHVRFNV